MSVRERSENCWQIKIYLGRKEDGTEDYHYETFHGNETQANKYHDRLKKQIKKQIKSASGKLLTVENLIDKWANILGKEIEDTTKNTYIRQANAVKPLVEGLMLYELNVEIIEERLKTLDGKIDAGILKVRTVRNYYSILKRILAWGASRDLVQPDLMKDIKPPKVSRIKRDVYSQSNLNLFIDTAKEYKHYLPLRILGVGGLRVGELIGGKWKNLDLTHENGKMKIVEAMNSRTRKDNKETKTLNSERTIIFDVETTTELLIHKENMQKLNKANDNDFIFLSEDGNPLRYQVLFRAKERVLKKAGLHHIRIHDLRHGVGSILLDKGYSLTTVAEFLGQTPATTAAVYGHSLRLGNCEDVLR